MATVYLVDDDESCLRAMDRRLHARGYEVRAFATPGDFLDHHDKTLPGCALLDLSLPQLSGMEVYRLLQSRKIERPVVFLTGHGDIPTSVQAMKAGAVDFLTKPVEDAALLDAVARAVALDARIRRHQAEAAEVCTRLARLTPREHEVLMQVAAGRMNKQIAYDLGTVEQTVKVHRRRAMEKMGAGSLLELARMLAKLDDPVTHS